MSRSRNRGTQARRWLSRRDREGWTLAETSRRSGIPRGTLAWWSWKLREEQALVPVESEGPAFVEVSVLPDGVTRSIEVIAPNGYRLLMPDDFDGATFERILEAVERRC